MSLYLRASLPESVVVSKGVAMICVPPPFKHLTIILFSFTLLVPAAQAATTIQSFTVSGNVVGNSNVTATGTVTINRDPSDTGTEYVMLGQGFSGIQVTCADGGYGNACYIPAGSNQTTFQMLAVNTRETSTTVTLGISVAASTATASLSVLSATYGLRSARVRSLGRAPRMSPPP